MVRRLGDILIEERLITPAQRDEALRQQKLHGGRIGTNLVELGAVEMEALTRALARQKGVPAALQKHFDSIHREVVGLVPAQLAQKHSAIPLGFTSRNPKTLAVAFLDPAKAGAIDEIQFAASARIYPVIAPELRIFLYLEKLYGIPRQLRFLRMERANPDAAGKWQPTSGPAAQQTPAYLSPPETTPAGAIPASDPLSFFDMTRPDLSRPRTSSAILLTEAVSSHSSDPVPQVAGSEQASAQRRTTAPRSGNTASQSKSSLGTAAASAKPAASNAATKPKPSASDSGARAHSATSPAAAVPSQHAEAAARRPPREGTPPPLPVPEQRRRSPSTSSQSAPPGAAMAQSSKQTQGAGSAAAKPKLPSSTPAPKAAEAAAQRADRSDAPSRAPTIPDIPAFAIDLETRPSALTPGPASSDEAKPATEPSTAPTIKIDFDPSGEPLPHGAATSEGTAMPGAPSPETQSVSPRTPIAPASPPSASEPTSSGAASEIQAKFPSIPIDELWGQLSDSPVEAAGHDDPLSAPLKESRSRDPDAPAELARSPAPRGTEASPEDLVAPSPALASESGATPNGPMPDWRPQRASASPDAAASAPARAKTSGAPAPRPWSATEAVDAMAVAANRDQIADAIVNYLRSTCGVGLVMIVQHEVAMGWKGFAPGLDDEAIASLGLPLAAPSVLQIAYRRQTIFSGTPAAEGAQLDKHLWEVLRSSPPKEAIVAPIIIRDRVVNLIYGHAADGGPLPDRALVQIGMLCRAAAAAYVRLIQAAKVKSNS